MAKKRTSGKGLGSRAKKEGEQLASFFKQSMGTDTDKELETDQELDTDTGIETEPATRPSTVSDTKIGTNTGTRPGTNMGTLTETPTGTSAGTDVDTDIQLELSLFQINDKPELERKVFYITKEQAELIETQANRTGLSQSEIMRKIIDVFVKHRQTG